jgi:hypothetical protein
MTVKLYQLATALVLLLIGVVWFTDPLGTGGERSVDITVTWSVGHKVDVIAVVDGAGRAETLTTGNYHMHRENWGGVAEVHAYALTRSAVSLYCKIVEITPDGVRLVDEHGGLHSTDDVRCSSAR